MIRSVLRLRARLFCFSGISCLVGLTMLLFPKARKQADEEGGRSCDDANVQRRMRFVAGLDVSEDVRIRFGRARTGVRGQSGCGRFRRCHKLHHQLQVFSRHREGHGRRLAVIRNLPKLSFRSHFVSTGTFADNNKPLRTFLCRGGTFCVFAVSDLSFQVLQPFSGFSVSPMIRT